MRGDRLKKLRAEKKLTQGELGKIVNVTKVSISGYESGNRSPDTDTLQKLADTLDTSTDYLLGRDESRNFTPPVDPEFEDFLNDPRMSKLYSEYKESSEERREALFAAWEYLKSLEKK